MALPFVAQEFFVNILVRIHFIIVMIGWTGLAPGSLTSASPRSTFFPLAQQMHPKANHNLKPETLNPKP